MHILSYPMKGSFIREIFWGYLLSNCVCVRVCVAGRERERERERERGEREREKREREKRERTKHMWDFPGGAVFKNLPAKAGV